MNRLFHFNFFKGCLPQISLGPVLNTLSLKYHPPPPSFVNTHLFAMHLSHFINFCPSLSLLRDINKNPDLHLYESRTEEGAGGLNKRNSIWTGSRGKYITHFINASKFI